jgi:1-acyl-sn-glycerol-3-phosphate acyltransferase
VIKSLTGKFNRPPYQKPPQKDITHLLRSTQKEALQGPSQDMFATLRMIQHNHAVASDHKFQRKKKSSQSRVRSSSAANKTSSTTTSSATTTVVIKRKILPLRQISGQIRTRQRLERKEKARGENLVVNGTAQEVNRTRTRLWSDDEEDVSIVAVLRCVMFTLWTFALAIPLFLTMCLMFPFVYVFDKTRRNALSFVNDVWAVCSTTPFVKITVTGRENLPKSDEAAVYVANHQSFMDIFSLFHLRRPFKFISKTSNFVIPIIGWSMFLTGHVPLKRTDRRSQMETLKICRETLQKSGSVLFFPEGTRSQDGLMQDFKKGAFSVAAKENCPVIPITLVDTGKVMQNGKEWMLRRREIKVIVHPRIDPSEDADYLTSKAFKTIKESLVMNS